MIKVGDTAQLSRKITEEDVLTIADLTGDTNLLHMDENFAAQSRFGKKIVHGILSFGLISAVIGTKLPGNGSIYLNQNLNFILPVFIGDKLTAIVEVMDVKKNKPIYSLKTFVVNQKDEMVVSGDAIVFQP